MHIKIKTAKSQNFLNYNKKLSHEDIISSFSRERRCYVVFSGNVLTDMYLK